jgi:HTH-type transcriptional regulator / antitoxin HipB
MFFGLKLEICSTFVPLKQEMTELAQLVQNHRKKAGLTQAQLAMLAGVGKTFIWDVEHRKESVQWNTLQKIFRVLNITVEWRSPLLDRTVSASPPAPDVPVPSLPAVPPSSPSNKRNGPPTSGDPTTDRMNPAKRVRHS